MGLFDFLRDLFSPVKPLSAPSSAPRRPDLPPGVDRGPKPGPAPAKPPPARPASRPVSNLPPLPRIGSAADLAVALSLTPPQLKWLTLECGRHYATFQIPKKRGQRTIEAPKKKLRAAQRWIHRNILSPVPVSDSTHGFRSGRSPATNARPHVGKELVIKLDLRDFFWKVDLKRVRGVFQSLGYPKEVAALLWRLCCHNGRLPQGAPTSPAITNLCCRALDARLAALSNELDGTYTRYADDLTFSFRSAHKPLREFLATVKSILRAEGFPIAREKTRILRPSSRQSVTGITVNRKLSPPRSEVRTLRALLHDARLHGAAQANRLEVKNFGAVVRGRIEAVRAIDKAKGEKLLAAYRQVAWG